MLSRTSIFQSSKGFHMINQYSKQYVFACTILSFLFGFHVAFFNVTSQHYVIVDDISVSTWTNMIALLVFLGAFVGAIMVGFITQNRSFHFTYRITAILYIIAGIAEIIAGVYYIKKPSLRPTYLYIIRFFIGVAIGLSSAIVPVMINEMCVPSIRGVMGFRHQLAICLGILTSVLYGSFVFSVRYHEIIHLRNMVYFWIAQNAIAVILALIGLIYFHRIAIYHSPQHYMKNRNWERARDVIEKMANSSEEADQLFTDYSEQFKSHLQLTNMGLIQTFSNCFYLKLLLLACFLSLSQQFSGINVLMSMSTDLFSAMGSKSSDSLFSTVILALTNVIVTCLAGNLIDRVGRKSVLLLGVTGEFLSLMVAALCLQFKLKSIFVLVAFYVFVFFFAFSHGPVTWVYIVEMLPQESQKISNSISTSVNWLSAVAIIGLSSLMSPLQFLYFCSAFCGLTVIVIIFCVKETRGLLGTPYKKTIENDNFNYTAVYDTEV